MDDTFQRLLPIIGLTTGMDPTEITCDTSFGEDLMLDSLSMVEFMSVLESEFGVKIEREDADLVVTVGDLVGYIDSRM